jgi:hypothetical protein
MPKVRLVRHDPDIMKNISELQRLFIEYGNLSLEDAKARANDVREDYQVSIDIEDSAKAKGLIRELECIYIKAEIVPEDER